MNGKIIKLRRYSQFIFFVVFFFILLRAAFSLGGGWSARFIFALNPLTSIGVSIASRTFTAILIPAIILLVLTAIFGRFFCGWICPVGSVKDILGIARKEISSKELYRPFLRFLKYLLLLILFIYALMGLQHFWVFDPLTISGRFFSLSLFPASVRGFNAAFGLLSELSNNAGFLAQIQQTVESFLQFGRQRSYAFSSLFFYIWIAVLGMVLFSRRFWCRTLCPLGALLALAGRFAPFKKWSAEICSDCQDCARECRMKAISRLGRQRKTECILCGDCLYRCRGGNTTFGFKDPASADEKTQQRSSGLNRRDFIKTTAAAGIALLSWGKIRASSNNNTAGVIRPPGAVREEVFKKKCIRCGNCMSVCKTNGLQPALHESGPDGIWTPRLEPEIGYCEYSCNECGRVCPVGAIEKLDIDTKQRRRIGTAEINRSRCQPWQEIRNCLLCMEACPVPGNALRVSVSDSGFRRPLVDEESCIGCGRCQNTCPFDAIDINPKTADRK